MRKHVATWQTFISNFFSSLRSFLGSLELTFQLLYLCRKFIIIWYGMDEQLELRRRKNIPVCACLVEGCRADAGRVLICDRGVLAGGLVDFFGAGAFAFRLLGTGVGSSSSSSTLSLSSSERGSFNLVTFRTTAGETESGSGSGDEWDISRKKEGEGKEQKKKMLQ